MSVIKSDDSDFQNHIDTNKMVVVKFFADWCGSCKLFSPKYKRIANDEMHNDLIFLDVNAEENENARKLAGVDNLPFFATFLNGNVIEASATSKEDKLLSMIGNLREKNQSLA